MVVAFLFPSPLEVTWVINQRSMHIDGKIEFPSPLEVTWVINKFTLNNNDNRLNCFRPLSR